MKKMNKILSSLEPKKIDMNFEYDIFLDEDIISVRQYDDNVIEIVLSDFWDFVKKNQMHHFCNDFYDPSERDGHGQVVGKYSESEYFELPYNEIKEDLSKFLSKQGY